jgi:hypothetical protein
MEGSVDLHCSRSVSSPAARECPIRHPLVRIRERATALNHACLACPRPDLHLILAKSGRVREGLATMGEFAEGSYIDAEGKVRQADGEPDPLSRWIDERGYVRIGTDGYEDDSYVDGAGNLYDANGSQLGTTLQPDGWTIQPSIEPQRAAQPQDVLWTTEDGQDVRLSTTQGTTPSDAKMAQFQQGIPKTRIADAQGGDLTWAGGDFHADDLHGRQKGPEFVGEDQSSQAFRPGTARVKHAGGAWTTAYGASDSTTTHQSVRKATVDPSGLLLGPNDVPLNGDFGYVIDAADGTLYTFDRNEMYLSVQGKWMKIDIRVPGVLDMAMAGLKAGEKLQAIHHTTAVSGAPAAGAGAIKVANGKITSISNESGHYTPEGEYLWQTIEWLAAQGMKVEDISVVEIQTSRDATKILRAWQVRQTGGNVAQAQAKADAVRQVEPEVARREAARLARLRNDLTAVHLRETGGRCPSLSVAQTGETLYCTSCDQDLDEKYMAELPA